MSSSRNVSVADVQVNGTEVASNQPHNNTGTPLHIDQPPQPPMATTISHCLHSEPPSSPPTPSLETAKVRWQRLLPGNVHPVSHSRPVILSNHNTRLNSPWGDLIGSKGEHSLRVYAININGITLDKLGGTFDTMCQVMRELQIDVMCLQEHNLDTTQVHIRSTFFDTAAKHWERNRIVMGTTPITFATNYKPGGTMMITTNSATSRIVRQDRDK